MKKLLPIFLVLIIAPCIVYAQNTTIESQNITIKTEIQESPETRELLKQLAERQQIQDEKFNQLIEKLSIDMGNCCKNQDNENNVQRWTEDGLLTTSATIIGFSGFSTLLIIKFQNPTRIPEKMGYLRAMFVAIGGIIISHVYASIVIVMHYYNTPNLLWSYPVFYSSAMLLTAFGFSVALFSIYKITKYENAYSVNLSITNNIIGLLDGTSPHP